LSGDLLLAFDALHEGGVALTPEGLTIEDSGISFEHYRRVGKQLGALGDCVRFAAGDWMNAGLALFAYDAFDALGVEVEQLKQYRSVAEAIPPPRRRIGAVPWSLHRLVKNLEPREQLHWLGIADEYRLTYRELEQQLRAAGLVQTRVSAIEAAESTDPADPDPTSTGVVEAPETGQDALVEAAREVFESARRRGRIFEVPDVIFERLATALGEAPSGVQLSVVEVTPDPKRKGESGS
jgi:hypothetical protein